MGDLIQLKRGLSTSWATKNLVLQAGEPGYETDTGKMKIGDGTTAWNNLDYSSGDTPLILDAPPTTSTVSPVGRIAIWHDANATDQTHANHLYHMAYITTSESTTLYHWEECVLVSQGNVAGGYPILDANGKIASAQLPPMDYIPTSEKGAANGVAGLNANAKVPSGQLPYATSDSNSYTAGIVYNGPHDRYNGLPYFESGKLKLPVPTATGIAERKGFGTQYGGVIHAGNLNAAVTAALTDAKHITLTDAKKATAQSVFGVGGPITAIPAATSQYTLSYGRFSHVPELASVYGLPAVADGSIANDIVLTIKFSATVLTYEFQDSAGNTLVPLPLNGDIEAGSVVTFLCRYNPLLSQWVIYPIMDGKEAE